MSSVARRGIEFLFGVCAVLGLGCGDDVGAARQVNLPPTAVLEVPAGAVVGEPVRFTGTRSSDSDGTIVQYHFSPGDDTGLIITADSETVYTYDEVGQYVVTLTVVDDRDARGAAGLTLAVLPF